MQRWLGLGAYSGYRQHTKCVFTILTHVNISEARTQIIRAQGEHEDAIRHLYAFVFEAGPTKIFESHEHILALALVGQSRSWCGRQPGPNAPTSTSFANMP
jgi:hypothetical protein